MTDPLELLDLRGAADAVLVLTDEGGLTRGELLLRAAHLARELTARAASGQNVVVTLDSGPAFVAALAGCWLAGATPVLLDPLVRHELGRAVERTRARVVVQGPRATATELPPGTTAVVPGADRATAGPTPPVAPERPVLQLFTSGSTGEPTLVPKRLAEVAVELRFLSGLLAAPRRAATLVPWCHIYGLYLSLFLPARAGGLADLRAGISPRRALDLARDGAVDLLVAVPAIYRVLIRLLEADGAAGAPLPCRCVNSGALLAPAIRERFAELAGQRIVDLYGSTEAGGIAWRDRDGPWTVQPHVEWRIGAGGLLEVRSPSVSVVPRGEFYRVGDLVRRVGDGFVLAGRADDVVKIGGRRIALGEVEQVLEQCPGVAGAAVVAVEVRGELRLVAYVESPDPALGADAVKAFVRGRLADHKVPSQVHPVAALPRTPAGKLDRPRLMGHADRVR